VELEPWSHTPAPGEKEGTPNVTANPSFVIGGNCTSGFAPSFLAGTVNSQAGAYSPFTLTFSRHDGEQDLSGLTVTMPEGLIGKIAGFEQCPEAAANTGTCGSVAPGSRVGTASAAAGSGSDPFWQTGSVYLTGPYNGGPFGLSVVVPAVAGPYDLGNIVVRASIRIDPSTAQVTVVSDPLPQSVDGVPLRVQTVNVTVGQEDDFTFNPTNCNPLTINGTLTSTENTQGAVSSRFQAANCATLPFKPAFTVSTQANTSKADGASLKVNVAFPHPGPGTSSQPGEANIHSVKVELPKALPSRLTTLQKACTAKQFAENPAGCPAASIVGHAIAHTPIFPVPLEGPAYFVSNGSEAFPNLIMVLQGYGITIDLVGDTFISKSGITSSTFKTVPDAPVNTFELILPEGPYSALAANGNLCQQNLTMPTAFVGQNGAILNQDTHIEVTGCSTTLSLVSKSVKKKTLKLTIYVPAGGKVTASGKGLNTGSKSAGGRETVTITLHQKHGGKLKTKIKLSFKPSKGKKQSKTVTVSFKK
jgi:hypothetical protein